MKKLIILTLLIFAFGNCFSQTWEKYDNTIIPLESDLTLIHVPTISVNIIDTMIVDGKVAIRDTTIIVNVPKPDPATVISPYLYYSQEVLSVDIDGANLIITHKGYMKGFEWMDVIIYREVYGVVLGKMKLIKIVDGKYTAPVTIPEKTEFQKVIAVTLIIK